jgi:hypothetical protein
MNAATIDVIMFNDLRSRPHVERVVDVGKRYRVETLKWCGKVIGERFDDITRGKIVATRIELPKLPEGFR